jgi:hypothetical protein
MAKYIKKIEVDIVPYKKGMEDKWEVNFEGQLYRYSEIFNTEDEALKFIKENKGMIKFNDKDYGNVIYKTPYPIIESYSNKRTKIEKMIILLQIQMVINFFVKRIISMKIIH